MKWKKVLRITALTLIPGGLVALGAWAAVKALRPKNGKGRKSHAEISKVNPDPIKKEEL
jgi:hypothetical protein